MGKQLRALTSPWRSLLSLSVSFLNKTCFLRLPLCFWGGRLIFNTKGMRTWSWFPRPLSLRLIKLLDCSSPIPQNALKSYNGLKGNHFQNQAIRILFQAVWWAIWPDSAHMKSNSKFWIKNIFKDFKIYCELAEKQGMFWAKTSAKAGYWPGKQILSLAFHSEDSCQNCTLISTYWLGLDYRRQTPGTTQDQQF